METDTKLPTQYVVAQALGDLLSEVLKGIYGEGDEFDFDKFLPVYTALMDDGADDSFSPDLAQNPNGPEGPCGLTEGCKYPIFLSAIVRDARLAAMTPRRRATVEPHEIGVTGIRYRDLDAVDTPKHLHDDRFTGMVYTIRVREA